MNNPAMLQDGNLADALRDIVGTAGLISQEDLGSRSAYAFANVPVAGKLLVRPANTEECSAVLKLCNELGQTVITHGGRTGLAGSLLSVSSDVILSTERMNKITSVNTIDRCIHVEAGVPLQQVQEAATEAGLFFPVDLGARGSCTIGGNIATNAGGNAVIRYGMIRDWVLGLEVVLADGTVIDSMHALRKDNTGIDLKQLFVGSEGILGIVTKAILRLAPATPSVQTALLATDKFDKLPQLLTQLDKSLGGNLSAFEVMWDNFYNTVVTHKPITNPPLDKNYPFYVLVETQGANSEVDCANFTQAIESIFAAELICDGIIANSEQQRQSLWDIRDDVETCLKAAAPMAGFDISLPLTTMEDYLATLAQQLQEQLGESMGDRDTIIFGHLGDGNLHINVPIQSLTEKDRVAEIVYGLVQQHQGSISAEHGVGLAKRDYLYCSRSPGEIALMKQLKRWFDPHNILNPGRIVALDSQ